MAYRVIHDRAGVAWQVWEVHPTLGERRQLRERRLAERATAERRRRTEHRPAVATHLTRGWLAFQSEVERRRRAPIPPDWELLTDDELLDVLDAAEPAGNARRLIE